MKELVCTEAGVKEKLYQMKMKMTALFLFNLGNYLTTKTL